MEHVEIEDSEAERLYLPREALQRGGEQMLLLFAIPLVLFGRGRRDVLDVGVHGKGAFFGGARRRRIVSVTRFNTSCATTSASAWDSPRGAPAHSLAANRAGEILPSSPSRSTCAREKTDSAA